MPPLAGYNCAAYRLAFVSPMLVLMLTSCREPPPAPETVTDEVKRGPLAFTVVVSPKEVRLGDPISVELRVHTPENYVIEFPPDDALGDVQVRRVERPDPRPGAAGGLDWRQTYSAVSFTSGPLEISPLVVKYARRPQADAEPDSIEWDNELATGTLTINVRSALTTQDSVQRPRDITGTLLPEWRMTTLHWAMIAAAGIVIAALTMLIVYLVRSRRSRPAATVLPEVWALRELYTLASTDWIETGRAREYYYELTHIVCRYIELKFDLAAPEMTTEEFLTTLARDRGALPYDANRLRTFLEACDIVKYAALRPRAADAEQAMITARAFINATAAARAASSTALPPGGASREVSGGEAA